MPNLPVAFPRKPASLAVLMTLLLSGFLISSVSGNLYAANEAICFAFPQVPGNPGSQVELSLHVTNATAILSVEATITYPSSLLSVASVDKTAWSNGMSFAVNTSTPGVIYVSMASANAISGDNDLFKITFSVASSASQNAAVQLTRMMIDDKIHSSCITQGEVVIQGSTYVDLLSFEAAAREGAIQLEWSTAFELDNAGFHIWRKGRRGGYRRLSTEMIPARGMDLQGADYAFRDADVLYGRTYAYRLEDIDSTGLSTFHGPVYATAGDEGIRPVSPRDETWIFTDCPPSFRWKGIPIRKWTLQFSRRSDFKNTMITIGPLQGECIFEGIESERRGAYRFSPFLREWRKIMERFHAADRFFWRVRGEDEAGRVYTSSSRSLKPGADPSKSSDFVDP